MLFYGLLVIASHLWLHAAINADGIGFFPVVVIVTNEQGLPIRGVTVQLQDSGKVALETVNDPIKHSWMERVGQPADTDSRGVAVLFYYGHWSSTRTNDKETYGRQVRGKVVIDVPGYERFERTVADVAGGANTSKSPDWAPTMTITMKRKQTVK